MAITDPAVLDACVLYPATLRDLLVELASRHVIEGRWTAEIHEEWMRSLKANRPDLDPKRLERTRGMMDLHAEGSLVTGHLPLIPALTLPDPDDRHVLAAAIQSKSTVIVTFNLKDFPGNVLARYKIEAKHPDEFLHKILALNESGFCAAMRAIRERLNNPPKTAEEGLITLEDVGLVRTVARLRDHLDLI